MPEDKLRGPEISVVIPCFNEEDNAAAIAAAAVTQMETVSNDFDIIFIDNGSTDRTVDIVRELCAADKRIKLIRNTRNFGQLRSPTHAVLSASGRAVIGMVADFQDPPEMIPQFVERWRNGAEIVLATSRTKKVSPILAWLRALSYRLQRRFGDYPIIPNATGFGLYDRKVVDAIATLNEPEPFFRGLLVETGYRIETIPFTRPPARADNRKTGSSRFSILRCRHWLAPRRGCCAFHSMSAFSSSLRRSSRPAALSIPSRSGPILGCGCSRRCSNCNSGCSSCFSA